MYTTKNLKFILFIKNNINKKMIHNYYEYDNSEDFEDLNDSIFIDYDNSKYLNNSQFIELNNSKKYSNQLNISSNTYTFLFSIKSKIDFSKINFNYINPIIFQKLFK